MAGMMWSFALGGIATCVGQASSWPSPARVFSRVDQKNAVPSGPSTTQASLDACEAQCTGACLQYSWNKKSHHCFTSESSVWKAIDNARVESGCLHDQVGGCPDSPPAPTPPRIPKWEVKGAPDTKKKYCGFEMLAKSAATYSEVYHASKDVGAYNHAVMIDWFDDTLLLSWKNSPVDEDSPGQRILYSQSTDGKVWTPSNGSNVLFPNVSTANNPAALFAGPTAILNGRRYATASPRQFCLFPDPYESVLMMRQVLPGSGRLGPIFWVSASIPSGFEEASRLNGIASSSDMGALVQADLKLLHDWSEVPCSKEGTTLKCEACANGCDSNFQTRLRAHLGGGAEYAHYVVPNSTEEIILHRTKGHMLDFTDRANTHTNWSKQAATTIPDARSNLNAGPLPDGRVYMLSNACSEGRDPLVMSFTSDGWSWNQAIGVMSCEGLGRCGPRYKGKSKDKGVAYPQGVTVTSPASVAGFYAAASNNKEDIWVAKIPFDSLPSKADITSFVV